MYDLYMDHTEKAGISEPVIVKNVSDLGMIIRDERKRKNLSQAELAARAGVSRRLIYQLENGTKDSFPIGKVLQVIRRLNLELRASKKRSD